MSPTSNALDRSHDDSPSKVNKRLNKNPEKSSLLQGNNTTSDSYSNLDDSLEKNVDREPKNDDEVDTRPWIVSYLGRVFSGVLPNPIRVVYYMLSLEQELPIASITYILNNELSFSPTEVMTYYTLTYTPWLIKPVYGFISDQFPILGYRRKPYVFLSALLSCLILFLTSQSGSSHLYFKILGVTQSTLVAISEVMMDGVTAELGNSLSDQAKVLKQQKMDLLSEDEIRAKQYSISMTEFAVNNDATQTVDQPVSLVQTFLHSLSDNDRSLLNASSPRALVQSEAMAVRSLASVQSSLLSMLLLYFLSPHNVILVTAFFPVLTAIAALTIKEQVAPDYLRYTCCDGGDDDYDELGSESQQQPSEQRQGDVSVESPSEPIASPSSFTTKGKRSGCFGRFLDNFVERVKLILYAMVTLIRPVTFVFIVHATPSSSDPYYSYLYGEYTFPAWLLSGFSTISLVGSLLGSLIYWKYLSKLALKKVFFSATVLDVIATLPLIAMTAKWNRVIGISDMVYIPIVSFIGSIFSRIALMPSLVLAAESCPPKLGLEATMFSVFTSVSNAGGLVSYSLSMLLVNFFDIDYDNWDNLPDYMLLCAVMNLLPLLALSLLPAFDSEVEHVYVPAPRRVTVEEGKEGMCSARVDMLNGEHSRSTGDMTQSLLSEDEHDALNQQCIDEVMLHASQHTLH